MEETKQSWLYDTGVSMTAAVRIFFAVIVLTVGSRVLALSGSAPSNTTGPDSIDMPPITPVVEGRTNIFIDWPNGNPPQGVAIRLTWGMSLVVRTGLSIAGVQWCRDGGAIEGEDSAECLISSVRPENAGLYSVTGLNTAMPANWTVIVGISTSDKVNGAGREIGTDITHPNRNIYDQVLLENKAVSLRADPGQVTRTSYVDRNGDIVQVEFSGAGVLTLVVSDASAPAAAEKYKQSAIAYVKGHAGIVISDADETTNVSVFSVGRVTAVNQELFRDDVAYDGVADLAYIAVLSTNGKFGGVRCANANFFALRGLTGIYAPGVQFTGPVYIGDLSGFDDASPVLICGATTETMITGGNLQQANGRAVQVSGLTRLKFADGTTSHGGALPAQANQARLEQNGVDVTAQIVVNPTP